jgi:hypothetical protein
LTRENPDRNLPEKAARGSWTANLEASRQRIHTMRRCGFEQS